MICNRFNTSPLRFAYARQMLALVGCLWLLATGLAQAQAQVSAIPNSFSADARIRVNASGLAVSTNHRLRLEQLRPGTQDFDLLNFSSGTATSAGLSVTIPNAPPGNYEIVLYRVPAVGSLARLAGDPVTLSAPLGVSLTPNQGAPGRRVAINVTNLVTGSLRISYAGQTILGPVPVGGSYSGKFVVPADRPATLPATASVVVENLVGRLVVRRATLNFSALARSTLPRLGLNQPQVPAGQIMRGTGFPVSATLTTSFGLVPTGQNSLYFIGGGITMPMDNGSTLASNGQLQMTALAPSAEFDGYSASADLPGQLVLTNRGISAETGARQIGGYRNPSGALLSSVFDGPDFFNSSSENFVVVVRGPASEGSPLLQNIWVQGAGDFKVALVGIGGATLQARGSSFPANELTTGMQVYQSPIPNQFTDLPIQVGTPAERRDAYGCTPTYFRKKTSAAGRATFQVDADTIAELNVTEMAVACKDPGPCGFQALPPTFHVEIFGAHQGYLNTVVSLEFDNDTGLFTDSGTGIALVNGTLNVTMDRSATEQFKLGRSLRIDGLGEAERLLPGDCAMGSGGICHHNPPQFRSMYVYPAARWPSANIQVPNVGRKVRLTLDTNIYGTLSSGRIKIGTTAWAAFSSTGAPSTCLLDAPPDVSAGIVEHTANLPDLTRLPVGVVPGTVELNLGGGVTRTFGLNLYTDEPEVFPGNPNVRTLSVNALNDEIRGSYNIPGLDIPVASPGQGVGPLNSMTVNDGDFALVREADGAKRNELTSVTNNDIAANPGAQTGGGGTYFGFSDFNNSVPDPVTLFDTGIIPLFRYTFGLPPVAQATLGADFWMAATLGYYGQQLPQGMNATIDPKLAGGVNLFFDLDVLAGLVSGSMSAESELSIAMRAKINQGGLEHLPGNPSPAAGKCFNFILDAVWEACAVGICDGGRYNMFTEREPNGCNNNAADGNPSTLLSKTGLNLNADPQDPNSFDLVRPRYSATAMGGDGRGNAVTIRLRNNTDLVATHISGGVPNRTLTIAANTVGVQHIDIAYYASNQAVAVWSENTRSALEVRNLLLLRTGRVFDDIARTQRLRFSQWDGISWSVPANLTTRGSDGKPQLAGCLKPPRFVTPTCPSFGEITAVWEHDANHNLDAPDLEIWSARWTRAGGWSTAARVSDTGVSSDMLPSVAYRQGVPVVAWARNPGGAFVDLRQRHIAYRFLDGGGQINATQLGLGVGWVDVGVAADSDVVLAFTRAQGPSGFVGNRQALSSARSTGCSAGSCIFLATELRDPNGRQFRVERPRVSFDENDKTLILFRGLAFGPDASGRHALPGDTPGMVLGTGELGLVHVDRFDVPFYTAQLSALSDDGLQHWKPDFLFDETMGGVLAVSMQALPPIGQRTPMKIAKLYSPKGSSIAPSFSELGDGASLRIALGGPDFELRDARLSRAVVASGQVLRVNLNLVNVGSNYVPAEHGSVRVVASLNGPAGAATELGAFNLTTSAVSNSSRAVALSFNVPAGVSSDELQTVFIDIVASDDANAVDGSADHAQIEINAMPVPTELNAAVRVDSPFMHLTWKNPNDSRVYGWRVWKLDATTGNWRHLGSTRNPGYADISGPSNRDLTYRVAAFSANGMESEPSASITSRLNLTDIDTIFSNGFEALLP